MFTISQDYNHVTSDSSMSISSPSISSMHPASPMSSISLCLQYIEPKALSSPKATNIQFSITKPIEPIVLQPIVLEDSEIEDIAKNIIPVPFTPLSPTQIQATIEHFEAIHCAQKAKRKLKVQENTTDKATNTTTTIPTTSQASTSTSCQFTNMDMGHSLGYLFHILQAYHTHSQQLTPSDQWDISMGMPTFVNSDSDDDDEDDKDNDSNKENWLEPPHTPPHGDDMHPPIWPSHSDEHLGHGWEVNSWGTTHYYRLLICNPITGYYIVAPYITYSINQKKPEILGTYGRGHPIVTHALRPTRVNYICLVITPP
jgi:hypothetical protein